MAPGAVWVNAAHGAWGHVVAAAHGTWGRVGGPVWVGQLLLLSAGVWVGCSCAGGWQQPLRAGDSCVDSGSQLLPLRAGGPPVWIVGHSCYHCVLRGLLCWGVGCGYCCCCIIRGLPC